MRVLQVIGGLDVGGAETFLMNVFRNSDQTKIHFDFLVYGEKKGMYENELVKSGAKVFHIATPREGVFRFAKELFGCLKKNHYDVVHVHTLFNSGIVLAICFFAKVKKRLVHSHSTQNVMAPSIIKRIYQVIMRLLIWTFATDVLACGNAAGTYLYGKNKFKMHGVIINNGIKLIQYEFNEDIRTRLRKSIGVDSKTIVIAHIGRLSAVKNHKFALEVIDVLKSKVKCKLFVIGEGDLKEELLNCTAQMELSSFVSFLGLRQDISELLQAIDVIWLPSFYEGFPVVLIEAQASGVKCVVSDAVTKEAKLSDELVFLPIDNPIAWAEETKKPYFRSKICRDGVLNCYNITSIISELTKIYIKA